MPKRLKGVPDLPFPPIVAAMYGAATGALVHQTPQWLFEHGVDMSGIARFIPAAVPPLGENARLLAAGGSAVAAFLLLWPLLSMAQSRFRKMRKKPVVVQRSRGIVVAESLDPPVDFEAPLPGMDAEIRAPIFAGNDLGAPLMSDAALMAGDELMLEEPLQAPSSGMSGLDRPAPAATAFTLPMHVAEEQPHDPRSLRAQSFHVSGFADETPAAAEPAPASPQWQIPEPQDYPTPPIQPPLAADSQFRIPGQAEAEPVAMPAASLPVFDPVSLDQPATPEIMLPIAADAPVNAGLDPLPMAAASRDTIDPFAGGQSWNLPGLAEEAQPESRPVEPAAQQPRISPNFAPGFNPLAIDLGDDDADAPMPVPTFASAPEPVQAPLAEPEPVAPAAPPAFVPAAGEIDPFAISFGSAAEPATGPSTGHRPVSPVQHAPLAAEPASEAASNDDSVQGLMARLNQAMGSRMRPAAAHAGSNGLDLGNLRAI